MIRMDAASLFTPLRAQRHLATQLSVERKGHYVTDVRGLEMLSFALQCRLNGLP